MKTFKRIGLTLLALGSLTLVIIISLSLSSASDHDDGETDTKGRNLNLTDLYVFREADQNAHAGHDLVFMMNTNPRSVARQQYYFSTNARYEFHVSRVHDNDDTVTGIADLTLRFEFGAPDQTGRQPITVTGITNGQEGKADRTVDGITMYTTPLGKNPTHNLASLGLGGSTINVFAGLREDPFFFDVEQYFRVRAGAAGLGPAVGFRSPGYDFTAGYNVNSIVVRVPIEFLQGHSGAQTFDVWETISVPGEHGKYVQVERLARPAINEGLVLTNDFLNALNSVGPDFEAAALAGHQPQADIAGPIVAEAIATLRAVGNSEERANALIGAFLPDVMRIDITGPSGYGNALNAKGSPIRGRMILDDVIDITLSVLTDGAITSDNVSYEGPNANGSAHQPLLANFPYLAAPN